MLDNAVLAGEILRHGAYVCVRLPDGGAARAMASVAIPALAEKLGLEGEFAGAGGGQPAQSIAFLRRRAAAPGARHTYFLPRYDGDGRMTSEGHALASAAGITCLLRRTYKSPTEPAPDGAYDFVTYFECAEADVPTFHQVCASLRDVGRNPEWKFVREGPTWHGRRVAAWADLFSADAT